MKVKFRLSGKLGLFLFPQCGVRNAEFGLNRTFHTPHSTLRTRESVVLSCLPSRGSILIACLIILATLTVYGGVLVSAVYERSLNVGVEVDRLQALYLAEAALAKSLNEVKSLRDPDGDGLGTVPAIKFGSGTYYAVHDPGTLAITGVGEVHGIKRRVRIKYEGL